MVTANLNQVPAWRDIAYLQQGSLIQRQAYASLTDLGILETLRDYDALLAGTVPLDLAIADSDLDILCEVHDHLGLRRRLEREYGASPTFSVGQLDLASGTATVANFAFGGFAIEVFGQPVPVSRQHAYRHMDVEYRLMLLGGEQMKAQITRLKQQGAKTEPAFATWLGLQGDPYAALLKLSELNGSELSSWYYAAQERTTPRLITNPSS
ncbi:MAG TPA: DUF4269 domain-containing protein [Candidatus Angelobacter sp.]